MSGTIKALIIRPDRGEVQDIGTTLEDWQAVINGGYLVQVTGSDWVAYCDEDGLAKQLDPNPMASAVIERLQPPRYVGLLVGTVFFIGHGRNGDGADVPARVIEMFRKLSRSAASN
jgi:hypothetical protein